MKSMMTTVFDFVCSGIIFHSACVYKKIYENFLTAPKSLNLKSLNISDGAFFFLGFFFFLMLKLR